MLGDKNVISWLITEFQLFYLWLTSSLNGGSVELDNRQLIYIRTICSDDRSLSDVTEQLYVDPYADLSKGLPGDLNCCPASPTTVPAKASLDSPLKRSGRRQRTTSIGNQTTTANPSECIIRANNRTIYTAGRPPWYNCAGQQVEPFVIGKHITPKKQIFLVSLMCLISFRNLRR